MGGGGGIIAILNKVFFDVAHLLHLHDVVPVLCRHFLYGLGTSEGTHSLVQSDL